MADLDDILSGIEGDEEETEETGGELDWLNDEEEEAPIPPKKTSKKKASKKKVSRKVAPPPEPEEEDEEEAPPPPRKKKKKVAKKAAAKPAPAPEPEEEAPAPKRRGPKPGVKRGPRKARVDNDVLTSLRDELNDIATGDAEKSQIAELKANIRTAKQLETQLGRFYAKVEKAVEAQSATVEKLEAQLAKLTAE